jgi:general secretion pathway protein E
VLAQRLVRLLCNKCKTEDILGEHYASQFGIQEGIQIYKNTGCKSCDYTGYTGRRAIGELFIINSAVQELIKEDINDNKLREMAIKSGMKPLDKKIKKLLIDGKTSLEEVIRIGL